MTEANGYVGERYLQLFAWEGAEPTAESVIAGLAEAGIEVHRSEAFPDAIGGSGWRQVMLAGFQGEPVFIEMFRPNDSWEGTLVRGTFEQQLRDAFDGPGAVRIDLPGPVAAVKFIFAASSLRSAAAGRVIDAVRQTVERSATTVARIDGRLEEDPSVGS